MYTSQITIGSQTNAIKASKILKSSNISCEVIKTDKDRTKGCIFGVRVITENYNTAISILRDRGFNI